MSLRIVYLATADARGHLMRAQLLVHALRKAGARVEVLTTSGQGQRFLRHFGVEATILSAHYAVQFDSRQNMLRTATHRNVACYLLHPRHMLRDTLLLRRWLRGADLVINDSFHPALLCMGMLPGWRCKVVHVYGGSLKAALLGNFQQLWPPQSGRLFAWLVGRQIAAARCRIEHDFAYAVDDAQAPGLFHLPTPVALAAGVPAQADDAAAVYLNPHFSDPALADAVSAGLADAGLRAHRVGEGYAGRQGWVAVDPDWASHAAQARLIVSAPGMAALSIALVYQRPIILILSNQPEQAANAERASELRLLHRVVTWNGDAADFQRQVHLSARQLSAAAQCTDAAGPARAQARIDAWVDRLLALAGPAPGAPVGGQT